MSEEAALAGAEEKLAAPKNARGWRVGLGALAIIGFALVVYWPVLGGGFIWDDTLTVEQNHLVTGIFGLGSIWFRMDFPLTMTALWLQWLVFGNHAAGYHVVDVLLHGLNAVLLWRLLARLRIPGAWLAGVIFAAHPVCVASAGWISEQKNTLSMAFCLGSFWWYVRSVEGEQHASPSKAQFPQSTPSSLGPGITGEAQSPLGHTGLYYWLSLAAFVLALLSKTTTVMLPVVLLAWAWWRHGRITRRDCLRASPYFLLALGFGLLTIWFQKYQVLGRLPVQHEGFWGRLAEAGRATWFYLGKAVWPVNLNMIYQRWTIDAASPWSYLPGVLLCGLFGLCWRYRHGWGRHGVFALGCYAVLLFPALGFFDMYYLAISRVSDHFHYLALNAPVALAAGAWGSLTRPADSPASAVPLSPTAARFPSSILRSRFAMLLPGTVVLALAVLTFQRAKIFASDEDVWRDTLAKNPAAWTAHNNLGSILAERQDYDQAAREFAASLEFNPANVKAHANLGTLLAQQGKFAEAETHFAAALQLEPDDGDTHRMFAAYLADRGKTQEALAHYREALRHKSDTEATRLAYAALLHQTGDVPEAAAQYRLLVGRQPALVEALNNLAWLLATSKDDTLRNGAEAVRFAERACRLTQFKQAVPVGTLAAAYAEAGRFQEAVATAETAIRLASAAGNERFAAANRELLGLYRSGRAYREQR
jgi:Flp pilus assembly protein TadD